MTFYSEPLYDLPTITKAYSWARSSTKILKIEHTNEIYFSANDSQPITEDKLLILERKFHSLDSFKREYFSIMKITYGRIQNAPAPLFLNPTNVRIYLALPQYKSWSNFRVQQKICQSDKRENEDVQKEPPKLFCNNDLF